jgi:hypothetical protein
MLWTAEAAFHNCDITYTKPQLIIVYSIEEDCRNPGLTIDQIKVVRQEQSEPILDELGS